MTGNPVFQTNKCDRGSSNTNVNKPERIELTWVHFPGDHRASINRFVERPTSFSVYAKYDQIFRVLPRFGQTTRLAGHKGKPAQCRLCLLELITKSKTWAWKIIIIVNTWGLVFINPVGFLVWTRMAFEIRHPAKYYSIYSKHFYPYVFLFLITVSQYGQTLC